MRILAVAVLSLLPAVSGLHAQGSRARVEQLAWLAGCWRAEAGGRTVDEMWMAPGGGAMLGTSRTVAQGTTVAHEFMQIRERDGVTVFIAMPSGQQEAAFPLARSGDREVTFENLAHDFPQRVMYRRTGDMLLGRIEGTQAGTPRSADFPMRRVACP